MSESIDKMGLVPSLRFPEFRNASNWTKRRLADEGEIIRGLTYNATQVKETGLPVLRSSNIQRDRLLLEDDIVHVGVDCAPNMLLRTDDLVVCMSNGSKPLVGKNAVYEPTDLRKRTIGAFCAIYRSTNPYARLLLSSPMYQTYVLDSMAGGNINNLTPNQLGSFAFPFPSDASEQRTIAECLGSLDELIAAETEKLEALKRHKKGLLQQLFPAEGETIPRLRFKEFRESGEWKEESLFDLGALIQGLTYSPSDVRDCGLLVLRSSNIKNGRIALDDCVYVDPHVKGANLSKPNDILICVRNGSAALIGKNALLPTGLPLCTHGAFMSVYRSPSANFVYQLFQTLEYQRQVAADLGATINSINGSQFVKYKFFVPALPEQQRVAGFLHSVDERTEAVAKKLESLKKHKAALMQQLFPSLEELETVTS